MVDAWVWGCGLVDKLVSLLLLGLGCLTMCFICYYCHKRCWLPWVGVPSLGSAVLLLSWIFRDSHGVLGVGGWDQCRGGFRVCQGMGRFCTVTFLFLSTSSCQLQLCGWCSCMLKWLTVGMMALTGKLLVPGLCSQSVESRWRLGIGCGGDCFVFFFLACLSFEAHGDA